MRCVFFSVMMLTINNAAIGFAGTVWILSWTMYAAQYAAGCLHEMYVALVMMFMANDAGVGF